MSKRIVFCLPHASRYDHPVTLLYAYDPEGPVVDGKRIVVAIEIGSTVSECEIAKVSDDYLTGCTHVQRSALAYYATDKMIHCLADVMKPEKHAWWLANLETATY